MTGQVATFPPEVSSPREARQLVAAQIPPASGLDGEIAALLTSELATNAVRHARTDFTVTVELHGNRLTVAVADHSTTWPTAAAGMPATARRSGRGLALVASYAAAWGVDPAPGGKVVWFVLALDASA